MAKTPIHKLRSVIHATKLLKDALSEGEVSGSSLHRMVMKHTSFYAYYRTLAFLQECGKVERTGKGKASKYRWIGIE